MHQHIQNNRAVSAQITVLDLISALYITTSSENDYILTVKPV